jgi:endoglucanase
MRRRTLALLLGSAAVIAVGAAVVTAPAASAASGCSVRYTVTNQWPGGFGASVTIKNLGDPLTSWALVWSYPAGQRVTQAWSAAVSQSGTQVTARNVSYNGSLATNASTGFGFNGSWSGSNPEPASFTLNGTVCTGGIASPTASPSRSSASPSSASPSAGNTPVARYGQLRVCGAAMCDRNGTRVQLRGISSMWLNWESQPYAENLSALRWMRDNWNLQVIRAAMGVEPAGAYLSNPTKARDQVETIINNAVTAGVYVIVDWHAHEAHNHRSEAVSFFSDLARRYGHLPNVIWEPYNEPKQVSWTGVIKPYHQAVVSAIRAADPDNIIVLGTPTWSQQVDVAASSPVSGTNLMYTLHFYACSHGAWLRAMGDTAMRAGLALFVTEWGASHADGGLDGRICQPEAQAWIDWMRANGISWAAWKLDVGTDTTNLLSPGAPVTGGWNNYLRGHGPFVVASMR